MHKKNVQCFSPADCLSNIKVKHGLDVLNGEERALCTGIEIQASAAWLPFLELVSEPDKTDNAYRDPSLHLRQYHAVEVGGRFLDLCNVTGPPIKHVVPIVTEKPVINFRF